MSRSPLRSLLPLALLGSTLALPGLSQAAGIFTPDTISTGISRGGAYIASAHDVAGALYYNPATLVRLKGFRIDGGVNLFRTTRSFTRAGGMADENGDNGIYNVDENGDLIEGSLEQPFPTTTMTPDLRPIPEVGIAFGIEDPDITIALGLYAPIAPVQRFERWGPGRYRVIDQELVQGNVNLAIGVRPLPWLSFGAGFQILLLSLEQSFMASADFLAGEHNDEDPQFDVLANFEASQVRPYFNAGLLLEPTPWLSFGLSFSPPYAMQGRGSSELSGVLGADEPLLAPFGGAIYLEGQDEEIELTVGLPGELKMGLALRPVPHMLELEFAGTVQFWQGTGDIVATGIDVELYHDDPNDDEPAQRLDEHFEEEGACAALELLTGNTCEDLAMYDGEDGGLSLPADYRNTFSLRFGGSFSPDPAVAIRFGYLYEAPAIPDESLSLVMHDAHKHVVGAGISLFPGHRSRDGMPPFELRINFAQVFHQDREISAEVSRGHTIALAGVPTNPVDAGTYSATSTHLGVNAMLNISEIIRRDAERRAAQAQ